MELNIKPLLPYSSYIDEKTAMQETLKIWAWLKDTGKIKIEHPKFSILDNYIFRCPLCEVFRSNNKACYPCPLFEKDEPCYSEGNSFATWLEADYESMSIKQAAAAIYFKIFFEYKRRYNEEFNPYE